MTSPSIAGHSTHRVNKWLTMLALCMVSRSRTASFTALRAGVSSRSGMETSIQEPTVPLGRKDWSIERHPILQACSRILCASGPDRKRPQQFFGVQRACRSLFVFEEHVNVAARFQQMLNAFGDLFAILGRVFRHP